jgi:type II restriction enzyme
MNKKEDFKIFLSQLAETNATLDYFTDFRKIIGNVAKIEMKLNQLNYLIGKEDLDQAIIDLYEETPNAFSVLAILIAVRSKDKKKTFNNKGEIVFVESYFENVESITEFIQETGLGEVFRNRNIKNLVDYVFGVEAGLDSNTRKNRGGDIMSKAIALKFNNAKVAFRKEVKSNEFTELISLGVDIKRFDFVIKTNKKIYLIETNFYNSKGSKLNEITRAYSDVAQKINQNIGFEFVWITDGQGWLSSKNKLEEAYSIIPSVYNLITIDEFIEKVKKEEVLNF